MPARKLPRVSPVSAVLLRADNDRNGNPRRVFAVLCPRGIVEVLEEGYHGDALLRARWPWFDHRACADHGLVPAYYVNVDTTPGEVRRLERLEESIRADVASDPDAWHETIRTLRAAADRQHGRSAAEEAVREVSYREVHVHRHDPHRRHKLRALRATGAAETDHGHVITFRPAHVREGDS